MSALVFKNLYNVVRGREGPFYLIFDMLLGKHNAAMTYLKVGLSSITSVSVWPAVITFPAHVLLYQGRPSSVV